MAIILFLKYLYRSKQQNHWVNTVGLDEYTYKNTDRHIFSHLVLSERLFPHLNEVDEQAQNLLDTMIPPMVKGAGITKQLKTTKQMKWVGLINAVKAQVEETIFTKLIYD